MVQQRGKPSPAFLARFEAMKARAGRRRRTADWPIKVGMIVMLLLPAGFGYFAYLFTADALLAVADARSVEGSVREVEEERYTYREDGSTRTGVSYVIHVAFRGDGGVRYVKPLQHGGATDEDTRFARDALDISAYQPGTPVPLLYHPELEHRIWLDDFRALWLLPLVMGGATLVAGFLVVGGMIALWPRG